MHSQAALDYDLEVFAPREERRREPLKVNEAVRPLCRGYEIGKSGGCCHFRFELGGFSACFPGNGNDADGRYPGAERRTHGTAKRI